MGAVLKIWRELRQAWSLYLVYRIMTAGRKRRRLIILGIFLLYATPAQAATPTAFHMRNCSNAQTTIASAYDCRFPEPSLSGNLLVLEVEYGATSTVTVTDDQTQTWTCNAAISGGQQVRLCYKPNTAAGVVKVHIAFGTSVQFVSAVLKEVNNIATVTPVDVTCGQHNVGTTAAACGSMTTTVAGDWIEHYCAQDSAGTNQITWTAQSGFSLLTADKYDSQASQGEVQATAGAINPTLTMSSAVNSTCVGAAFKPATAGTAPTGMYVRAMFSNSFNPNNGYTVGATTIQAPCAGNAYFLNFLGEPNVTVTGTPTDSNSNTLTSTGATVSFGTSGNLQAWQIGSGATCSSTMTVSFTTTGSQVSGSMIHFFDIVGSGGYDTRGTATGNQTVAGSLTTSAVTPTNASGITFWVTGVASDTVPSVSPGTFVSAIPTPVSSPNDTEQNNGYGINHYSSTATQTFVAGAGQGGAPYDNWASTASVFFAPLAAAPSQLPTLGCCLLLLSHEGSKEKALEERRSHDEATSAVY